MPDVTYSTKEFSPEPKSPEGVLVYMRTAEGNDALAWINTAGESVTQSQLAILKAAECEPNTPALPRNERHHLLVAKGVEHLIKEEKSVGGQLGRPSGARFKTYERLKRYLANNKGNLFSTAEIERAFEDIYRYPLRQTATDTLNRVMKSGVDDEALVDLVVNLWKDGKLCQVQEEAEKQEPRLICSMGVFRKGASN
jgi:hypothetical protein